MFSKFKTIKSHIIVLAILFSSVGNRGLFAMNSKKKADIVVYTSPSDKKPWDILAGAYPLVTFGTAVFGRLVSISRGYHISPGIIESWHWNDEKNELILKVATDAHFHNGRKVDSSDIEFNLIRTFITETKIIQEKWINLIKGTDVLKPGMKYNSGMVEGIKVINEQTIALSLKSKDPTFIFALGKAILPIYPREELRDDFISFRSLPVGAGPYKVIWSDPGSTTVQIELVNPLKNAHSPRIIELISGDDEAIKKADIVIGRSSTELPVSEGYKTKLANDVVGTVVMDFNFMSEAGENKTFRKLIQIALDRKKIAEKTFNLTPQFELIPEGMWGHLGITNGHDIILAKSLLNSLPESLRSQTHILGWSASSEKPILEIVRQLESLGLKVKTRQITTQKIDDMNKDIAMYVYGTIANYLDPSNMFSIYLPDSARPYQHPKDNFKFQKLFEASHRAETQLSHDFIMPKLSP